jgi:hypothetical protein
MNSDSSGRKIALIKRAKAIRKVKVSEAHFNYKPQNEKGHLSVALF